MKDTFKEEKKRIIIGTLSALVITILILLGVHEGTIKFRVEKFDREIDVNYGDEFKSEPGEICYGSIFKCDKVDIELESDVNTKELGRQKIVYKYKYKKNTYELKQTVNIVDKEEPNIVIESSNIGVCPNNKIKDDDIKVSATDNYDGDLTDKIEMKVIGDELVVSVTDSSDNTKEERISITKEDKEPPKISIVGKEKVTIKKDSKYKDLGAIAKDDCDDVEVKVEDNVDTSKVGTYKVKYSATDESGNTSTKERTVIVEDTKNNTVVTTKVTDKNPTGRKIIYLTFDDGPSQHTPRLLDVLKKYDVKVTFFVTGSGSDDVIRREYEEGHTVALHSASHNYSYIYKNAENYYADLYKVRDRVKRITGQDVKLIRFPGGSSNTVSRKYDGGKRIMSFLVKDVQEKGFKYFDWNVSSGDAGETTSTDKVYSNVVNYLRKDESVVLQHDSKGFSVDAVERIIKFGLANGYTFKALDEDSYGAHHGLNN